MKNRNIDLVELTKIKEFESIKYIKIKGVTIHNKAFNNKKDTVTLTLEEFKKSK